MQPFSAHDPSSLSVQSFTSPSKSTLASTPPSLAAQTWWQPRACAFSRTCTSGKGFSSVAFSGLKLLPEAVEWILIDDEPDAEMSCVGVAARENMSVGWAWGIVCI
jgi:hypothetical protein